MITIPGAKGHIYTYVWYRVDTTNITCLVCKIMWKVATGLVARHTCGRQKNSRCCTLHALRYGYSTHPWWYKYVYAYDVLLCSVGSHINFTYFGTKRSLFLVFPLWWDGMEWDGSWTPSSSETTYVDVGVDIGKKRRKNKQTRIYLIGTGCSAWTTRLPLYTFAHIRSWSVLKKTQGGIDWLVNLLNVCERCAFVLVITDYHMVLRAWSGLRYALNYGRL